MNTNRRQRDATFVMITCSDKRYIEVTLDGTVETRRRHSLDWAFAASSAHQCHHLHRHPNWMSVIYLFIYKYKMHNMFLRKK